MKTLNEIIRTPRVQIVAAGPDGGQAYVHLFSSKKPRPATVVFSWGGGWDHVSVSFSNRCPDWEEMSELKRLFFLPEETAWEYHPAESEYVNNHPYCLHIWRCQQPGMPTPPSWMVGAKKGQTLEAAMKEGKEAMS